MNWFILSLVLSLICLANGQIYNSTTFSVVQNTTCSLVLQVNSIPTYKYTIVTMTDGLTTPQAPAITCLTGTTNAVITSVNTWTSTNLGSNTTQWSSTVTLENLYKCLGVYSTSSTQILVQAVARYNVTVNNGGSVAQTGNCTVQIATNNTGVTMINYTSGSVLYTTSLLSTSWVNADQFQFIYKTCFVKPSNTTSYLYNPTYTPGSGGYAITGLNPQPSCAAYPGQDGCCQTWVGTTASIALNSATWMETIDFSIITGYLPLNNTNFRIGVLITAVKPPILINTTSSTFGVTSNLYGDAARTNVIANAYNGARVYARLSLGPVSDCTIFTLTVQAMDICYSSSANPITGCGDAGAVVSSAYSSSSTAQDATLWSMSTNYRAGCTSDLDTSWIANIVGPTASTSSAIPMIARFTYSFTRVNSLLGRYSINEEPLVEELPFTVSCQPGTVYSNSTQMCVATCMGSSANALYLNPLLFVVGILMVFVIY